MPSIRPTSYEVLDEYGLLVAEVPSRAAADDLIFRRGLVDAEIVASFDLD